MVKIAWRFLPFFFFVELMLALENQFFASLPTAGLQKTDFYHQKCCR